MLATPIISFLLVASLTSAGSTSQLPEQIKQEIATTTPIVEIVNTSNKYGLDVRYEKMIKDAFGKDGELMVAVAIAESTQYNTNAINYNCEYTRADGSKYSTSCKKEDRKNAWSVDCGILQINQRGQTCDEEMFDPEKNIAKGVEIYKSQGLRAWSAYNNGSYKKYLDFAAKYIVMK